MTEKRCRKLLVVNQYYAPDVAATGQLAADICESMSERGVKVYVVAGEPSYTSSAERAPLGEARNGVQVRRVPMGRAVGRESLGTRLRGYVRFLRRAARVAEEIVEMESPDTVLTFHNPPLVGRIGARLARRHGLRFVYAPQDIHPDILVATNWLRLPGPLVKMWDASHRRIMSHADEIVVLGEGMKRTLVQEKGVPAERVRVAPLWARPELQPQPRSNAIRTELSVGEEDLLLLYAGNMGIMHPLDPIADAAALLRGVPVRFLFLGDGAKRRALVLRVERERLESIRFLPFQSQERFRDIVAAADACFVALQPGLERLAVPSRSYTFLSAGRPLITLMAPEADIARLVRDGGCGWNVRTGAQLADLIRRLAQEPEELRVAGRRARDIYESRFQKDRVLEEYARLLRV
ncbi:MAG: glycosyltransferase family 4 protein [Armatimonadetes bacterium]|nr:glycosyltransferase family 4 protein [Armatimonadota bacterium]